MTREEFCPNCEDYRQTRVVDRKERHTVRGRRIEVPVRTEVCATCGQRVGTDEGDQQVLDAVHAEYRRQTDLLSPQRIKEIRKQYRLSQRSFAALLGMSEATINRYEQGALQDPAHDTAIRTCEKPEVVRDLLRRRGHLLSEWQRNRAEAALAGQAKPDTDVLDMLGEVDWICMPKEVSDRSGFRRFDYQRFAAAVLWFCRRLGEASRTMINKLMFYADFLCFKTSTVSLTGAAYRRRQFGPAPADFDGLLSRMESEGLLAREDRVFTDGYVGYYYRPGPSAGKATAEFSPHDNRVLEHVAGTVGQMTAKAASDKSHQEAAWTDTADGQLISYHLAGKLSLSPPG